MPNAAPPRPPRRPGPRPLALHLTLHLTSLLASCAALESLRSGSVNWKPPLRARAAALRRSLARADAEALRAVLSEALRAAVLSEALRRADDFAAGVLAYRDFPERRGEETAPAIWREGSSRLLDYAPDAPRARPVLVVPSLVNRFYVLDIAPRRSLLRGLARRGLRPLVLDWGAPSEAEAGFGLEAYVAGRLGRALDAVLALGAGPPALVGYCMGGLMALALALPRQDDIAGLALLATPWDFHRPDDLRARQAAAFRPVFEEVLARRGQLPVDLLQAGFTVFDPAQVERKFRAFARLDPGDARARAFVALEDWANDGVPLTAAVARETLFGWYVDNAPARGLWRIGGRAILPQGLRRPSLTLLPARDRIVPPASAAALAEALRHNRSQVVEAGHVGMVAGGGVETTTASLAAWLSSLGP